MRHSTLLMRHAGLGATLFAVISISSAYAEEHPAKDASERLASKPSLVIPCDEIIGAEIRLETGAKDEIEDLAFASETGLIHAALLESGQVLPFHALRWMPEKKQFAVRTAEESQKVAEPHEGERMKMWLLSHVDGLDVYGVDAKNEARRAKLANCGGIHVDVNSGHVDFIVASVGGVLGIGADSKVIPWEALALQRNSEGELELFASLDEDRLNAAPQWGDAENQLHNPEYRDRIYAFYGVEKPDHDRAKDDGVGRLVTIDTVIGSDVIVSGKERTIEDVLVHPQTGELTHAELSDGAMVPFSTLEWQRGWKRFQARSEEGEAPKVELSECIHGSALEGATVRASDGEAGSAKRFWIDLGSQKVAYASVTVGATLGLGGEEKVLPYRALSVERKATEDDELALRVGLTKSELERAPSFDESVGADIYNPVFRSRVEAFTANRGVEEAK